MSKFWTESIKIAIDTPRRSTNNRPQCTKKVNCTQKPAPYPAQMISMGTLWPLERRRVDWTVAAPFTMDAYCCAVRGKRVAFAFTDNALLYITSRL